MKLEEEIKQKKFKNEFHKLEVNILFTASWKSTRMAAILKPFDITLQQYNILRILRGQHPKPAPLKLLTERMIDKMSNTSRLVEKLHKKGWVLRESCEQNRRQVDITITSQGLNICELVTKEIDEDLAKNTNLNENEAAELNRLLDKLRDSK